MENYKIINKSALQHNLNYCKSSGKQIMVMVKANAYGHGDRQIVNLLKNNVSFFGVANTKEAIKVKRIVSKTASVLVVTKSKHFKMLILNNIHITIDELSELYEIEKISKTLNKCANIHIAINTGMNRIGVKKLSIFKQMLLFISQSKHLNLVGMFTHMFDADQDCTHINKQLYIFKKYVSLAKDKCKFFHIGGSYCLNYKLPKFVNMVRCGLFVYGYGNKNLKPVLSIKSTITKTTYLCQGEYIGYGHNRCKAQTKIAQIPLGYADGFSKCLENNFSVFADGQNNTKSYKSKGSICMDCFFVDITKGNVMVGDKVVVFNDANYFANILQTSCYEVLTHFSHTRAKTIIVNKLYVNN